MNLIQRAALKLVEARRQRHAEQRLLKDREERRLANIALLIDQVAQQFPLKDRDSCVLLDDDQYRAYAEGHFAYQLSICLTAAAELIERAEQKEESDFRDDLPNDLEY
jgi:hypothetical protein